MKTADLKAALALAKPCLGSNDAVAPIVSHFGFEKGTVYAFDQVVGISVDLKHSLAGSALHGDTLCSLLDVAKAESVEAQSTKGVVQLKLGAGWVKLPTLPLSESQFKIPTEPALLKLKIDDALVQALTLCLLSASDESIKPEFAGITCSIMSGHVVLFAGDNRTAARCVLSKKPTGGKSFDGCVIPTKAAEQIVRLASGREGELGVGAKAMVAVFADGTQLVSQLLAPNVKAFESVFSAHAPDDSARTLIPEDLGEEIAKASVLLSREAVKQCRFEFKAGTIDITASGALGQMESRITDKSAKAKKLAGVTVHDPALIARALPSVKEWGVNDKKSLVLHGEGFTYIVSSTQV